jgi:hypothetical protein
MTQQQNKTTYTYRIWDEETQAYLSEYEYLGQDGYIYTYAQDDGPELVRPHWFEKQEQKRYQQLPGGVAWYKAYDKEKVAIEAEIRQHQYEWYRIEFLHDTRANQAD